MSETIALWFVLFRQQYGFLKEYRQTHAVVPLFAYFRVIMLPS